MPAFPIPQSENIVTVGATGVYVAKSGDVVVAAPGAAVHLPSVPLPVVATQAQAPTGAATGPSLPSAPAFPDLWVNVRNSGATGAVTISTSDGSTVDGASGATGATLATLTGGQGSVFVTDKLGAWHTVGH
jgi:hypothetical protein